MKTGKQSIEQLIFILRGQKVMLSHHLARLYGVETHVLVQAVRRNIDRFPEDFMFQLADEEFANLKSQIVISSWGGSRRAKPYAFTEQGVAMLSSVLRSKRAVQVNIEIMRTFVRVRELMGARRELAAKLKELETRIQHHDKSIEAIFEAIHQLMSPPEKSRKKIGFEVEESAANYRKRAKKKTS